ncbi:MAG TPA: metallophosphoesterase family protein [Parafilimonas sp.]|nr:metallophosphoesterase family protein [Parafilimonas sp.]
MIKNLKAFSIFILVSMVLPLLASAQDAAKPEKKLNSVEPAILRGPFLQVATPTSMVVRWRTDVYSRSSVHYGLTPGKLDKEVNDSTLISEHIIKIPGLQPFTKYYYSIGDFNSPHEGNDSNYFYTLPETGSEQLIRVAALGDCANNSINQRNVRDQVLKYLGSNYLNAWILLGDNAYSNGTDAEFQAKFFNLYQNGLLSKYPLFPVPGNHDYRDLASASVSDQYKIAYFQNFSVPEHGEAGGVASNTKSYYSFDIGNVHFLALDSYGPDNKGLHMYDEMSEQVEWVKKDLKANKSKWIVAYWHHPPYTMGSHNSDTERDLTAIREHFIKVLEESGVDLVLCGHSHVYERSRMMKGHYGNEAEFDSAKHNLNSSSGLYNGSKNSAPYLKSKANPNGTVYVVSGSAGQLGGHKPSWPHEAMYYSDNENGGAVMLEVQGNRLDLKWICGDGQVRDQFTMMKDVNKKDERILLKDKKLD